MAEGFLMRSITRVYIHCTDSGWGNVDEIRQWHTDAEPIGRGWSDIGYHWLVTGLFPYYPDWKNTHARSEFDGVVWAGRPEERVGAHVAGDNTHSIGIALVGIDAFTSRQMDAATKLVAKKCLEHDLSSEDVWGHCEFWTKKGQEPQKSCPNIAMPMFRKQVDGLLAALRDTQLPKV